MADDYRDKRLDATNPHRGKLIGRSGRCAFLPSTK